MVELQNKAARVARVGKVSGEVEGDELLKKGELSFSLRSPPPNKAMSIIEERQCPMYCLVPKGWQ